MILDIKIRNGFRIFPKRYLPYKIYEFNFYHWLFWSFAIKF